MFSGKPGTAGLRQSRLSGKEMKEIYLESPKQKQTALCEVNGVQDWCY